MNQSNAGAVASNEQLGLEPERAVPVAEVKCGRLQWAIPRDDYRLPLRFLNNDTHPLYDQAALDAAVAAERRRFVAMLEYAMELDGFGCACEPDRKCGTCQARDTVKKALGPLLRTLKA